MKFLEFHIVIKILTWLQYSNNNIAKQRFKFQVHVFLIFFSEIAMVVFYYYAIPFKLVCISIRTLLKSFHTCFVMENIIKIFQVNVMLKETF